MGEKPNEIPEPAKKLVEPSQGTPMECQKKQNDGNDESKRQYEIEYVTEKGQYIMECVMNKYKEGVKKVFSKHVTEICNLDKEIDDLFMFFDGEIISYDDPKEHGGMYYLFSSYQVYRNNKDYEGYLC